MWETCHSLHITDLQIAMAAIALITFLSCVHLCSAPLITRMYTSVFY